MDDREALTRLRSLVVRGDGAGLVAALSQEPWPGDSLQLIGEGLLAAVRGGTDGSAAPALDCVSALRERRWDGDRELVEVLEAAVGKGPTPLLRPLPVDLEELSTILEGDPVQGGGRIDLTTGQVWPQSALGYAEEVGEAEDEDPDRWFWVDCEGSGSAYQDMVWFIEELDDPEPCRSADPRDLRARSFPPVQRHSRRPTRPDNAVVRVLRRPPTRASPQLAGG